MSPAMPHHSFPKDVLEHGNHDLEIEDPVAHDEPDDQAEEVGRHQHGLEELNFPHDFHEAKGDVGHVVDQEDGNAEQVLPVREANDHEVDGQHVVQQHGPEVVVLLGVEHLLEGPLDVVADREQEEESHLEVHVDRPDFQEGFDLQGPPEEDGQMVALVLRNEVEVEEGGQDVVGQRKDIFGDPVLVQLSAFPVLVFLDHVALDEGVAKHQDCFVEAPREEGSRDPEKVLI